MQQRRADASFHPPISLPLFYVLVPFVLQLAWVVSSVAVRRPWRRPGKSASVVWRREARRIGLPLLLNAGWVYGVLVYLPATQGTSLPVMTLYVPDVSYVLMASAAVAIAWGCIQPGLRLYVLRDRHG